MKSGPSSYIAHLSDRLINSMDKSHHISAQVFKRPHPVFTRATNGQQDNRTGILHQVAQHPIDQAYLYTRCPWLSPPMPDLEEQGTGCKAGRPVRPSKTTTPCSYGDVIFYVNKLESPRLFWVNIQYSWYWPNGFGEAENLESLRQTDG